MGIITTSNLTKNYGSGKGIFNVAINVKEGEVFGFLGPNGAGKQQLSAILWDSYVRIREGVLF